MIKELIIGTRGSKLALWQAEHVKKILEKHISAPIILKKIKTTGDKILDSPLSKIGDKGLFVKEIEQALLKHEIHLAVHSMKDMPTMLPDGLKIAAALPREDPRDAFISNKYNSIEELPISAKIGTSSLRRKAQLLNKRPDLQILDLRGNLDTRFLRLDEGLFDAIILAGAGVKRLGLANRIRSLIPKNVIMPAVGQGAIAIETRTDDPSIDKITNKINHNETFQCILAERSLMRSLEGGCQVPIGASAISDNNSIKLSAVIADIDGRVLLCSSLAYPVKDAEKLGADVAADLIEKGGGKILEEIRGYAESEEN